MAKGVQWKGATPADAVIWVREAQDQLVRDALELAVDVQVATADYMQAFIRKVPSSIVPGKVGRVDTGLMHDSVDMMDPKSVGKNQWVVSSGWVREFEDYFLTQEYGGVNDSGHTISPMHMLMAGSIYMTQQVDEGIKNL